MAGLERSDLFHCNTLKSKNCSGNSHKHDPETSQIAMIGTSFSDTMNLTQHKPKKRKVKPEIYSISNSGTCLRQSAQTDHKDSSHCEVTWRSVLFEYSQNTTFHGPRLIFERQPFHFRRFIWLCVFFGCTVIFLIKGKENVSYYLSWPVSVDVKINYNDSLLFPAFTLCNANSFRVTKAAELGYYSLLTDMFSVNGSNLENYNTSGLYLDELYKTGHNNSDLIVSCKWDQGLCSYEDFVVTMTDYGKCYTFNKYADGRRKMVHQTGTKGGLQLQLNIEQYEYMRGPNEGAGLKILLHHPKDIPLVRDYGASIAPGTHGLVALKILEVHNQRPNYGKCNDSIQLTYSPHYSIPNCYTDCEERYLAQECGCRAVYMLDNQGSLGICSVDQYISCMKPKMEMFYQYRQQCRCPIPCNRQLYETTVSYTTTSNFDIEALLRMKDTTTLRDKYIEAREVTERVDKSKVVANVLLIRDFNNAVFTLDKIMTKMHSDIHSAMVMLKNTYEVFLKRVQFHNDMALNKVKSMLEYNFIRGTLIFGERAFHYVTQDFYGLPNDVSRTITQAIDTMNMNVTDKTIRGLVYLPIYNLLNEREDLIQRAREYMVIINNSYTTGTPVRWNYRQSYNYRYDLSYVSVPLLHSGQDQQSYYYDLVTTALSEMEAGLLILKDVGNKFVETGQFDSTAFMKGNDTFINGSKLFNGKLHWYKQLVINKALDVINGRISLFGVHNRTLSQEHVSLSWRVSQFHKIIDRMLNKDWQAVMNVSKKSSAYLNNNKHNSKTFLSEGVTSAHVEKSVNVLTYLLEDIMLKINDLQNMVETFKVAYINVWEMMLNEIHTKPFYAKLHEDVNDFFRLNSSNNGSYGDYLNIFGSQLQKSDEEVFKLNKDQLLTLMNADVPMLNISIISDKVRDELTYLNSALNMADDVGNSEEEFLSQFKLYKEKMAMFLNNNEIGSTFYRENFLTLDVFVQELSYEEITQQKAYDVTKLLSDIGGLMGLFVGGSVVTIFELVDLFVHNGIRKMLLK